MKNLYSFLFFLFLTLSGFSQTTATNFNANDCAGINHDLFSELNSGKVILIDWVMPCSECVGPSKTAYNIVKSYASSHPGKVIMYVCDDYANTNCTSLGGWTDNNGLTNVTRFSNSSLKMSDYGSDGMPKIVIIGGADHTVYFNEINADAGNVAKLQAGINSALAAAGIISQPDVVFNKIEITPNPAINNTTLSVALENPAEISVELFNLFGQKVLTIASYDKLSSGINNFDIPVQMLPNGIYLVKISNGLGFKTIRLSVSN